MAEGVVGAMSDGETVLIVNPGASLYGSDRMTVESVKALVSNGFRVAVTLPESGPLMDLLAQAGARVIVQPTPVIRKALLTPSGLLCLARDAAAAWRPSWRLLKASGADTVVVNTITAPLWLAVARAARCTVVCHVHEAERSMPAALRIALYLPLVLAHRAVVNSRFSLEALRASAPWMVGRANLVYNAVAGPAEVIPPRSQLDGPARLIYLGRLSHRKGPHVAVEALGLLRARGREVELDLLGAVFPGNEAYERDLIRQIEGHGLVDHVRRLGFLEDVWGTVAAADMVIIPSTVDEPFGNTAVEASLAARPLVVSEIAGLKEASETATSRVAVPPSDPVAIAAAVEEIIDGWPDFARRAVVDSEVVADRFSFPRYAHAFVAALGLSSRQAVSSTSGGADMAGESRAVGSPNVL